jgi:TolB-like protein/Tfp pilus assembly protein PilF
MGAPELAESGGEEKASVRPPAVFISYASQDAEAANRICDSLRAAGIEVWFDQSELRGGDVWDRQIRQHIHDCRLFMPIVSANTEARVEGYFRREWKLAVDRTHDLSERVTFLVPIVIDSTPEAKADVPDAFRHVQWTRLPGGNAIPAFVERIRGLITSVPASALPASTASGNRTAQLSTTNDPPSVARLALWALSGVISLGLLCLAADRFWLSRHTSAKRPATAVASAPTRAMPAIPEKSVAVLPFVDMSEKKDQEYFADGLSEELIDHLAHVSDLKVIARTSSFQFKGKSDDIRAIGQRLGAANLLEGSVRTSGKTVRVTAQLISASDGSHLWSQTYDRDMHDIFKVQDAIANSVVASLKATISETPPSQIARPVHPEAYKAVLRGRYFRDRGTKEDTERSIGEFNRAQKLDPTYAIALAELARTYNYMGLGGWMLPREAAAKAREAAESALSIDPSLPLAHRVLASVEWNYDFDFTKGKAEEKRANDLDPNAPDVLRSHGVDALAAGRPDKAVGFLRKSVDRDPLNPQLWNDLVFALWGADQLLDAERAARTVLELSPQFAGGHCALGHLLLDQHALDEAVATMHAEPDEPSRLACLPDALWALGRHTEADAMLADAQSKYANVSAISFAGSYARRSDTDAAFKWLERAFENREPYTTLIKSDRTLRSLHSDPRWPAFLRKLHLPE